VRNTLKGILASAGVLAGILKRTLASAIVLARNWKKGLSDLGYLVNIRVLWSKNFCETR